MVSDGLPAAAHITYRQQYRRCGKDSCSRCASGGRGHGPYWYAFWWADGRMQSRYLGKHALAAEIANVGTARGSSLALTSRVATGEPLRVRTLGGLTVWRGGTLIPPDAWSSSRAVALFTCLLCSSEQRLLRDQAIEFLWPEVDPAIGAHRLRTTVHLLRQGLDGAEVHTSYLRAEGAVLALVPGGDAPLDEDWLDARAFAAAAHTALVSQDAGACRAALARYTGDYLPDHLYADWTAAPREKLRRQYLDLLLHLSRMLGVQGGLEEAEDCLRRALVVDPSHEGAALLLMRLLDESGRRGEALRVYQALATALEEDLDVTPGAKITALRARIVARDVAPIAASEDTRPVSPARRTNLPIATTSFVGRRWEVTEITELLVQAHMTTLTGPGGCGKTRLALEVAGTLVDAYSDGVWLVELAALTDPAGVLWTLAGVLGVVEQPGCPLRDALLTFLQPRHLLLVLDNCEHLIVTCAELATLLLQQCPHLRVLATSRESLEVNGEYLYRIPSLSVPDPDHLPPLTQIGSYEAVQLFLQRAQTRCPEVMLTAENADAVAQICTRLDGLPLAVELAAARVGVLSIPEIAARLDDRFQLLTGGPRMALPRQQTLRATIDWSHDLLSAAEQVLLRRLAVFAGDLTLEAAEATCAGGVVAAGDLLDLLTGLVHKSLVLRDERDPHISDPHISDPHISPADTRPADTRYRLLETVRQYSLEKLETTGELSTLRDRHLDWYLMLGERAALHFHDLQQLDWMGRMDREYDNLRAALHWSHQEQSSRAAAGMRLAGAIWPLWVLRGYLHEGRHWLEVLAAEEPAVPVAVRASVLHGVAELAFLQGDDASSAASAQQSLTLYRQIGDRAGCARVLITMGWRDGNMECARALGAESLALARRVGSAAAIAAALRLLGNVALGQGALASAQVYLDEGLALVRGCGDRVGQAAILRDAAQVALFRGAYVQADDLAMECLALQRAVRNALGVAVALCTVAETADCLGDTDRAVATLEEAVVLARHLGYNDHLADALTAAGRRAWRQGDTARATTLLEEGLSVARTLGNIDTDRAAVALTLLGHLALDRGDYAQAVTLHRESLALRRRPGAPIILSAAGLEGLAMALAVQGEVAQAVQLLGAAAAARLSLSTPLPPPDRLAYERTLAVTRAALGATTFAAAWSAGQAMTLDKAMAEAAALAETSRLLVSQMIENRKQ